MRDALSCRGLWHRLTFDLSSSPTRSAIRRGDRGRQRLQRNYARLVQQSPCGCVFCNRSSGSRRKHHSGRRLSLRLPANQCVCPWALCAQCASVTSHTLCAFGPTMICLSQAKPTGPLRIGQPLLLRSSFLSLCTCLLMAGGISVSNAGDSLRRNHVCALVFTKPAGFNSIMKPRKGAIIDELTCGSR